MNINSKFSRLGISVFSPHALPFRSGEPSYPIILSQITSLVRNFLSLVRIFLLFEVMVDRISVMFRSYDQLFIQISLVSVRFLSRKNHFSSGVVPLTSPSPGLGGYILPSFNIQRFSPIKTKLFTARLVNRYWSLGFSRHFDLSVSPRLGFFSKISSSHDTLLSFPFPSLVPDVKKRLELLPWVAHHNWRKNPPIFFDKFRFEDSYYRENRYNGKFSVIFDRFFRFILGWSKRILQYSPFLDYLDHKRSNFRFIFLFSFINSLLFVRTQTSYFRSTKSVLSKYDVLFFFLVLRHFYRSRTIHLCLLRNISRFHRDLKGLVSKFLIPFSVSKFSSEFLSSYIARRFSRGYNVRQVLTPSLINRVRLYHRGIRVVISGRFSKKLRADYIIINSGSIGLNSFALPVDYSFSFSVTRHGCSGVKVWLGPPYSNISTRLEGATFRLTDKISH